MSATDSELWDRAVAGDADAFGALFERHATAVYNYCFRRCADWSQAEDLTSIVFLEVWRRRGDISLWQESALPWLMGVATNVVRNHWRSGRRHRAAMLRYPPPRTTPDHADEVAARLDDEKAMRLALDQLRKLPHHEQDVLALCAWSDLSYQEAAAALGVPVGTVRSRLSRARQRLRNLAAGADMSTETKPTTALSEAD